MSVDPAITALYGEDGRGGLDAARKAWECRKAAAEAKVGLPDAPYRIRGDVDDGCWYVEEAKLETTPMPSGGLGMSTRYMMRWMLFERDEADPETVAAMRKARAADDKKLAELIAEHQPESKLVWEKIGPDERDSDGDVIGTCGFSTYGRALVWLREYLEPVREESTYFRPDGSAA